MNGTMIHREGYYQGSGTPFTTPSISATTTFYAEAKITSTGCVSATTTAVVATAYPVPAAFDVTGGGLSCYGSAGVNIGLSGSEIDVNYQLKLGGNDKGLPIAGTGLPLDFGKQTDIGTFYSCCHTYPWSMYKKYDRNSHDNSY